MEYKVNLNRGEIEVTYDYNVKTFGIYVYALVFPDNSVYIGSASQNIGDRIQNHATHYKSGKTPKDRAILRFKKFNVKILRECDSVEEMKYYERLYIHSVANNIVKEVFGINHITTDLVKPILLNCNLLKH